MLASVPPFAKPVTKAEFAPLAALRIFPGVPGASVHGTPPHVPETKNWLYIGGLFRKLSATVAGKKSSNSPIPPRTTVLVPAPSGVHANPSRGSHAIPVYEGKV